MGNEMYGVLRDIFSIGDFRPGQKEIIEAKQQSDRERLIEIMNYAKTEGCPREYINRYFGAPDENCGSCDNCMGAFD